MGKLTAVAVKAALTSPGTYQDGEGLFLKVDKRGGASWLLRIQRDGKRQDIGLGSAKLLTLAEARNKAFAEETRKIAMDLAGGDEKKLGQAIRNGMLDPSSQEILKRGREIGEAFRNAQTDEQRAALETEVIALRDQAMSALKTQLDKLDAAPAAAPAVPAPVIPTQGLM